MIVLANGIYYGPFQSVAALSDRLKCDSLDIPFSVLGGYNILEDSELPEGYFEVAETVPNSVTMRQARLVLLSTGLLDNVETAIDSLTEEQAVAARIEWDFSSEVWRHKGLVSQMASVLGLTEGQLDQLFIAAGKIL